MKTTKILAAIMLCVILIMSFASCAGESDAPDGFQLVACDGDEFRLYVPTQGWTSNVQSGTASALASATPYIGVSAFVADDAGDMTLEEYWAHCETQLKNDPSITNYEFVGFINQPKPILGGKTALKCEYTMYTKLYDNASSAETAEEEREQYKVMVVLCRNEGKMYVFTYMAPMENNYYDKYLEDVDGEGGMLDLFAFADPYDGNIKIYPDDVEAPEGMKLASTDERPYRFYVPTDWVANDKASFSSAHCTEDSSNVSVQFLMVSEAEIYKTCKEYFTECEARYAQIFSDYKLESEEDVTIDGISGDYAKKFTYSFKSGGVAYKQVQAIVNKGGVFYVITYTALPENFDAHIDDVNKIIENFDVR